MEIVTVGDAVDLLVIETEGGVVHVTEEEAGTVTGGGVGHVIGPGGGAGQGIEETGGM